jgi:hypothetical protein
MSSINTSLNNNIHNIDIVNRSNQRIIDEIIKIYANLIDSDVQKINFTRCTHSVDKNLIHVYVDCTNRQRLNELVMFLNEKSLVFVDEIIKTLAFPKKL